MRVKLTTSGAKSADHDRAAHHPESVLDRKHLCGRHGQCQSNPTPVRRALRAVTEPVARNPLVIFLTAVSVGTDPSRRSWTCRRTNELVLTPTYELVLTAMYYD